MNSEVVRSTEKYSLHGLDLDTISDMRDISGVCLQFMEGGHRVLKNVRRVALANPTFSSSIAVLIPRLQLEQRELDQLARIAWEEHGDGLGVDTVEKMKPLGGLWLCLISAIQQAGVPEAKKASIRATTHDPRVRMINYFYREVGNQLVLLELAGFSREGLSGFRKRVVNALKTTLPANRWWESQST